MTLPRPCVYVVECDRGTKIGISQEINGRVRELERAGCTRVQVIRVFETATYQKARWVEAWAHFELRDDRFVGEWFHTHPIVAADVVARVIRWDPLYYPNLALVDNPHVLAFLARTSAEAA